MKLEWERPSIPSFTEPQTEIIETLNLKPDSIVLEYGAGSGRYTIPIARKLDALNGDGIVFATAPRKSTLKHLDDRAVHHDLDHRIRFLPVERQSAQMIPVKSRGVDRLLTVDTDVLSQAGDTIARELKRILKPGGLLVVGATRRNVFRDGASPQIEAEKAVKKLGAAGFQSFRLSRPKGAAWAITAWK